MSKSIQIISCKTWSQCRTCRWGQFLFEDKAGRRIMVAPSFWDNAISNHFEPKVMTLEGSYPLVLFCAFPNVSIFCTFSEMLSYIRWKFEVYSSSEDAANDLLEESPLVSRLFSPGHGSEHVRTEQNCLVSTNKLLCLQSTPDSCQSHFFHLLDSLDVPSSEIDSTLYTFHILSSKYIQIIFAWFDIFQNWGVRGVWFAFLLCYG